MYFCIKWKLVMFYKYYEKPTTIKSNTLLLNSTGNKPKILEPVQISLLDGKEGFYPSEMRENRKERKRNKREGCKSPFLFVSRWNKNTLLLFVSPTQRRAAFLKHTLLSIEIGVGESYRKVIFLEGCFSEKYVDIS